MTSPRPAVLILDADAMFAREILAGPFRDHWNIRLAHALAEAEQELAQLAAPLAAAIVSVDLPDGDGLDLIAPLRSHHSGVLLAVAMTQVRPSIINRAQLLGVDLFCKDGCARNLRRLANRWQRAVSGDRAPFSRELRALTTRWAQEHRLSPREQQLLEVFVEDVPRDELAGRLAVAESTVKTWVRSILMKGGRDRLDEIARELRIASRHGD